MAKALDLCAFVGGTIVSVPDALVHTELEGVKRSHR